MAGGAAALVVLLVAVLALARARYTVASVEGSSMEPTSRSGDRLIVRRKRLARVRRGDVVVVRRNRAAGPPPRPRCSSSAPRRSRATRCRPWSGCPRPPGLIAAGRLLERGGRAPQAGLLTRVRGGPKQFAGVLACAACLLRPTGAPFAVAQDEQCLDLRVLVAQLPRAADGPLQDLR